MPPSNFRFLVTNIGIAAVIDLVLLFVIRTALPWIQQLVSSVNLLWDVGLYILASALIIYLVKVTKQFSFVYSEWVSNVYTTSDTIRTIGAAVFMLNFLIGAAFVWIWANDFNFALVIQLLYWTGLIWFVNSIFIPKAMVLGKLY